MKILTKGSAIRAAVARQRGEFTPRQIAARLGGQVSEAAVRAVLKAVDVPKVRRGVYRRAAR